MREVMLTTKDNPYSPSTEFDRWLEYDLQKGYNTCGLLARISHTSDALSDQDNMEDIEAAIDEIIFYDPLDLYRKHVVES